MVGALSAVGIGKVEVTTLEISELASVKVVKEKV